MAWFIGIDGGGTKTAFAIGKEDGAAVRCLQRSGCSYQEIGADAVVDLLTEGVQTLLAEAGVTATDVAGCCIGLPCYGENQKMDRYMEETLAAALAPIPVRVVNDGVVGWAGSLECAEGIHLVSGTGSIAFGCGKDGKILRTGGWCEFFGDEGSCYWVGRQAMSLFSKEADGRAPKGALYDIVRSAFAVEEDFDIIEIILRDIAPHREKVAAFQIYAMQAAVAGDEAARNLYGQAASELAQLVCGIKEQLTWSEDVVTVSYFGGLFKTDDLILQPLSEILAAKGCRLQQPKHTATEGALLLAIETYK
ncbi:MAG: ATPase [Clostridia bacterium]|nr:ATPase [Clostridia bacterium]